ncbi:hypothetical protein BKA81DRAFT_430404 [Phyllosticta paracitricarpa]
MVAVFKHAGTGLTYSKDPQRILIGMDSSIPTPIWSDLIPEFYTSRDGAATLSIADLSKPSVRLLAPLDDLDLHTETGVKRAMRQFRTVWRRIFPSSARLEGHRFALHKEQGSDHVWDIGDFIEAHRSGRETLEPPLDRLSFDTPEDAEQALFVLAMVAVDEHENAKEVRDAAAQGSTASSALEQRPTTQQ